MQLLVQFELEFPTDTFVLRVQAVTDGLELVRERLELGVVLGLDDKVVVLELVEVDRVLDHVGVF